MLTAIHLKRLDESKVTRVQFGTYLTSADVDKVLKKVYPPARHGQILTIVNESFDVNDFYGAIIHFHECSDFGLQLESKKVDYSISRPNYHGVIKKPAITLIATYLVETYLELNNRKISLADEELHSLLLDVTGFSYTNHEDVQFDFKDEGTLEHYRTMNKLKTTRIFFKGEQ